MRTGQIGRDSIRSDGVRTGEEFSYVKSEELEQGQVMESVWS